MQFWIAISLPRKRTIVEQADAYQEAGAIGAHRGNE
jgi:hypothetical protein